MVTAELEGTYGLLRYSISIANYLQRVVHSVGKRWIVNDIKPNMAYNYSRRVIFQVNEE